MVMAGEVISAADRAGHPGLPARLVLGGEQVGLGDDTCHLAAHLQHGHAADPVPGQQAVDLLVRRDPVHGHHLGGHHVADPPGPPALPQILVMRGQAALRGGRPLLAELFFHRVQRAGHVGPGGPAVQRLVVRGT
jgi:hypothetical protein